MATNGRGHFMRAAMVWRAMDCGAMEAHANGEPFDWIATVPPTMDRPEFIPPWARSKVLHGEDVCYWWTNDQPEPRDAT